MNTLLFPCPSCSRHIRGDEPTCRFCGASQPSDRSAQFVEPTRPTRARLFLFASVAAAGVTMGCPPEPKPAYGGPPPHEKPAPLPSSSASSSAADPGSPVGMYGAPPAPEK